MIIEPYEPEWASPPAAEETSSATTTPPVGDQVPDATTKATRPRGRLITIILLSVGLAAALAIITIFALQLATANALIDKQNQQIEEQKDLIDKKETFGAAFEGLLDAARRLDGTLFASIIPWERYERAAQRAWTDRWHPASLDRDTVDVRSATAELETLLATAQVRATTTTTGSEYESVIDRLSSGFVTTLLDDAHALCATDALACVTSDDPLTVHFDATDNGLPYMTDWLRTGIAYHEFAHVLQFTNPGPTERALTSFDGDDETMADCFALTYLDGWTLDHQIWTDSYTYWEVSIGYGYTCNSAQRQVIRDWYGELGFHPSPISQ